LDRERSQRIAQAMADLEAGTEKVKTYLRGRGVEYELAKDEVPFAVICPWLADAKALRNLGEQLLAWKASNPGVKRILGSDRLLDGQCPEVSAFLLSIPFNAKKPETCIEQVALVVVDGRIPGDERLGADLYELIERSGTGTVTSWEQYSYMVR
jgi:hypothetical protein